MLTSSIPRSLSKFGKVRQLSAWCGETHPSILIE
jgi:hypothetical protein